jgi:L-lactate dehydrogenase complex protein LldG
VTRAEFLARVRAEMAREPARFAATTMERPARPRERLDLLRRELSERWAATLERFRHEFERVNGVFHRVPDAGAVADVLAEVARRWNARRAVAWHARAMGVDVAAALGTAGLEVVAAPGLEVDAAERARLRAAAAGAEVGVTGADLAIAETGTLIVVSGAGRSRAASLLPPCHVAVFDRAALVETLAQVGLVLEAWHAGAPPAGRGASINFVTGPSRTADIELTLTRGVHGPKEVHAVFVEGGLDVADRV